VVAGKNNANPRQFNTVDEARADATGDRKIQMKFTSNENGEIIANKYAHFYNLQYSAAESGFLAAVYGGLYFNDIKHTTTPIKP